MNRAEVIAIVQEEIEEALCDFALEICDLLGIPVDPE
jgi:hypothetical protein